MFGIGLHASTTCCDDVKNVNRNTLAVARACAHDLYLSYLDSFL